MRVLLRPRWIAGHLVALLAVVSFVNLGFWQLSRLDDRRELNQRLAARTGAPARPLAELLAGGAAPDDLAYVPAEVTGEFVPEEELYLLVRSLRGRSGHHVLTPILLDDGRSILAERGWIPADAPGPPVPGFPPPEGAVTVTGILLAAETSGDAGDGTILTGIGRVDRDRLDPQVGGALLPVYLRVAAVSPAPAAELERIPVPEPTEGSHLAYAVQWFLFAAIVVIGYPFVLRRAVAAPEQGTTRRR